LRRGTNRSFSNLRQLQEKKFAKAIFQQLVTGYTYHRNDGQEIHVKKIK